MQNKEAVGVGILIGGLVLACVLAVTGFGVYTALRQEPAAQTRPDPLQPRGEPLARIYFNTGSDDLPEEAGGAIQTVKEKFSAAPQTNILISGFHDPSGDPVKNSELALKRAMAAQQALIEAGVPATHIVLRKPEQLGDTTDLQESRRVDIHLQ